MFTLWSGKGRSNVTERVLFICYVVFGCFPRVGEAAVVVCAVRGRNAEKIVNSVEVDYGIPFVLIALHFV
jgi:hypothetical protein